MFLSEASDSHYFLLLQACISTIRKVFEAGEPIPVAANRKQRVSRTTDYHQFNFRQGNPFINLLGGDAPVFFQPETNKAVGFGRGSKSYTVAVPSKPDSHEKDTCVTSHCHEERNPSILQEREHHFFQPCPHEKNMLNN